MRAAIERVASRLGNTPTICRTCYVHPEVVDAYLSGSLLLEDGHHASDYMVYAHLQLAQDDLARRAMEQSLAMSAIDHFGAAYAYAAMPARLALERSEWKEAAGIALQPSGEEYPWNKYPQTQGRCRERGCHRKARCHPRSDPAGARVAGRQAAGISIQYGCFVASRSASSLACCSFAADASPLRAAPMPRASAFTASAPRWIFGRGRVIRDANGEPVRYSGVDIDVTERKQSEEHRVLLVNELNHRVKNILATVQAIASQTFRNSSVELEVRNAFEGRILALSKAHNLLTAENWSGAGLRQLVAETLQPFGIGGHGAQRISAHGSEIKLPSRIALALSMALHELATNAAKYGALSNDTGRIAIV